jgi:hypothetical protein
LDPRSAFKRPTRAVHEGRLSVSKQKVQATAQYSQQHNQHPAIQRHAAAALVMLQLSSPALARNMPVWLLRSTCTSSSIMPCIS